MSFDWTEFYHFACGLAGHTVQPPSDETKSRIAISRAYYAAFCTARNFLRDADNINISSTDSHRVVRETFKGSADKNRVRIGNQLNELMQYRQHADYDESLRVGSWLLERDQSLKLAHRILEGLSLL